MGGKSASTQKKFVDFHIRHISDTEPLKKLNNCNQATDVTKKLNHCNQATDVIKKLNHCNQATDVTKTLNYCNQVAKKVPLKNLKPSI